jgi:uncharacterized protein (TIGR03086 family)
MNDFATLIDQDRRAVQATLAALGSWDGAPLGTPCDGWSLADLVAHMTAQQHGFARAVAGVETVIADWAPTDSSAAGYETACDRVLGVFAELDDPGAPVLLPEIREEPVPTQIAVSFHLVDNVVHAWDVAASLGVEPALDPDVLDVALMIARVVPDGAERERTGAAFAPARPVPASGPVLDEILLLLGREPRYRGGLSVGSVRASRAASARASSERRKSRVATSPSAIRIAAISRAR